MIVLNPYIDFSWRDRCSLIFGVGVFNRVMNGMGQLGQFLDSQTRQHCQQANMLQAESSAATIIGMITGVLGIVCVGVGLARRIKPQTISKPVG